MAHLYCCVIEREESGGCMNLRVSGEKAEAQMLKEAVVDLFKDPPEDVVSCDRAHFRCAFEFLLCKHVKF